MVRGATQDKAGARGRVFPVRSATAGSRLPAWLVLVRKEQEEARRVERNARLHAAMRGDDLNLEGAPAGWRRVGSNFRPAVFSLDMLNAALQEAAELDFLASRSEAAFCQAGVVAPPDSLTDETPLDFGEGF